MKVYDGATLLGTATANGSGAWSYTTAALAERQPQPDRHGDRCRRQHQRGLGGAERDGRHGGAGAPTIASFSTDSGTVGDGITNDNTLTLTGTAEANSTVKVYDGATLLGTATANGSGAWSYTTAALVDGAHSLTATATDAAGNTSAASAALNVTVDCQRRVRRRSLVLERHRHGGRRHHQRQHAHADRHGGGEQHGEGVRWRDAARPGDGQRQRRLELYHGSAGRRHAQPLGNGYRRRR